MKILITGYKGFIGSRLYKILSKRHEVYGISREDVDVSDFLELKKFFSSIEPDLVIHCASIGDINRCEIHKDLAYKVNVIGSKNIASLCLDYNSKLIYISSDQVYDFISSGRLKEDTTVNPVNFYGQTKKLAEDEIRNLLAKHFILRLSWQYGWHEEGLADSRDGIVESISKAIISGEKIMYTPNSRHYITFVYDTIDLICKLVNSDIPYGTYNVASKNSLTLYEIIIYIFKKFGISDEAIHNLIEKEKNYKAYSLIPESYNLELLGYNIPTFEEGLDRCFKELVNKDK